jgi:gamma-glutamyltranspeptidase / glutathione hydrolase
MMSSRFPTVQSLLVVATMLAASSAVHAQLQPELPSGWTDKSIVYTKQEMVAAANPLAVQAGAEILAAGGSAIDAAVAVQMVLGLVEPQSSGVGGGAFIVTFTAAGNLVETYDGRETAPARATERYFLTPAGTPLGFAAAVIGGLSSGVPGAVKALELAHKEKGRLPWARLFEPAIRIAESGFALSPRLFTALAGANAELRSARGANTYFYNADGTPKPVGTVLRNPDYAATMRAIAAGGADGLLKGAIANDIIAKIKSHPTNPGVMELTDMANYVAKKREPVCGTYRNRWRICGMGMPSSGTTTVLATLGVLQNYDVAALRPNSVESVHLISEAYRLAFADRAQYAADSDFLCVPTAGMINNDYLRQRATAVSLTRSMGVPRAGTPAGCTFASQQSPQEVEHEGGTSHLSIVDAAGNAVSMTTTVESGFGSHQWVRGFVLNNQLTDFSFTPTDAMGRPIANRVEPNKRPRSSMAPVLVFDNNNGGRLHAVIGSPGGSNIIQYVVKTLVGTLDWGLDVQSAINLGNFGAQTTATTSLEARSSVKDLGPALQALGHTVSVIDINSGIHGITRLNTSAPRVSGLGAIVRPLSGWAGGADPRREGTAGGR